MEVCGIELTQRATEIYEDIKSKVDFNYICQIGPTNSVKRASEHSFIIEISPGSDETAEMFSFKFIHEIAHIYQFMNGYKKIIRCLVPDVRIKELLIHLSDFVLDTDAHYWLKEQYHYDIHDIFKDNNKYCGYVKLVDSMQDKTLNDIGVKFLAVECAYIYFNESVQLADDLVNKVQLIAPNILNYYNAIIDEYQNGIICSPELATEKIIRIGHILGVDQQFLLGS